MSRVLPLHANFDHLRKQAKVLLRELQQRNPGAKLADAQHAIAREYGFASWPKLKAHVESMPRPAEPASARASEPSLGGTGAGGRGVATSTAEGPPPNYGFERYTPKARQALFFSRHEASEVGSTTIEPGHVLLGLIRAGEDPASRPFDGVNLSIEGVRAAVAGDGVREKVSTSVEIRFSSATLQILRHTIEEADRLRHRNVGIAHVLLGILRDERSAAASILRNAGMSVRTVLASIDTA